MKPRPRPQPKTKDRRVEGDRKLHYKALARAAENHKRTKRGKR